MGMKQNGRSIPVYRDNIAMSGSRERLCSSPGRARCQRGLARHRGRRAGDSRQGRPQQKCASGRQELAQGFCLSDRAHADGRFGNGCRQGAGKRQRGWCRADRAHRLAEHRGCAAATGAGHHHQRYVSGNPFQPDIQFRGFVASPSPARRRDLRFTRTACASTKRSATPSTGT
jgi:hypothetical protein